MTHAPKNIPTAGAHDDDEDVVVGIRLPRRLIEKLDDKAAALTRQRGTRIKRSTVVREIVHTVLTKEGEAP